MWFLTVIFRIINSSYNVKTFMQNTCVVIMVVMGVSESREGLLSVAWVCSYKPISSHIINLYIYILHIYLHAIELYDKSR